MLSNVDIHVTEYGTWIIPITDNKNHGGYYLVRPIDLYMHQDSRVADLCAVINAAVDIWDA